MSDPHDQPVTPSLADERQAGGLLALALEEDPVESNYRPGHEIARGGMGAVLNAHDQKLARSVAMKVMLRPNASPEERLRFQLEARVLGRLAHPNIVPVHDLGVDAQGRQFYTMKLVQGITLHELLGRLKAGDAATRAKYPLNALLTIFKKVCDAVAFAHSQGIIHRDLKPQNIMVGEFGEVLVMDWGLAKILPGSIAQEVVGPVSGSGPTGTIVVTSLTPPPAAQEQDTPTLASAPEQATMATGGNTSTAAPLCFSGPQEPPLSHLSSSQLTLDGTVMGTPNYMSPEQAAGRVAELDERSDVFSLGGVLYAVLTLRPPVEGKDVNELLAKVCRADITPPARATAQTTLAHLPDGRVPEALSAVAMKALRLTRDDRYQKVVDLGRDIEAYQGGFATAAEQAGAFTQLRLFIQRHKVISTAAAFIMLLTAAFIVSLSHQRDAATQSAREATAARKVATANEQKAKDSEAKTKQFAALQRRENARMNILLADAAVVASDLPGLVQALDRCPPDLRDQTWEYLAAKRDVSLGELKVEGFERPTALAAVPGQPGVFALVASNGEIGLVNAANGTVLQRFKTGRAGVHLLAFSPDGKLLAIARRGSPEVDVFGAADGEHRHTITLTQTNLHWLGVVHHRDYSLLTAIAHVGNTSTSTLQLVDLRTRTTRWETSQRGFLTSALVHPDGDRVMVCGSGQHRRVFILDARDGSERAQLEVYPLMQALSPDGRLLAVGTVAGELVLLNSVTGAVTQRGKVHAASLATLAWLGSRHLLTMGSEGKFAEARWSFRVLEAETLAPRGSFFGLKQGRGAPTWSLHPGSGDLLTLESPPRRWRFPAGRELARKAHESEQAWGGVFVSTNVLVARKAFGLTRYDERLTELPAIQPPWDFHVAAAHPASRQFALARHIRSTTPALKVFTHAGDAPVEKLALSLKVLANVMVFDSAGERLAVVMRDGALEMFSLADGRSLFRREGKFERVVFAGTNLFVIANHSSSAAKVDYRLERLDPATGAGRASLRIDVQINALAVSPDERLLAFAGGDRYAYFVHTEPQPDGRIQERNFFRAHDGEIGALAFHPTQPILATASVDGSVKFWDHRNARQPLDYFLGLEGMPVTLSFNPDGTRLLVDGQERTTRVYEVGGVTVK